ncbi:hypothetical protein D3C79_1009110 [compost metagenome]
MHDELTSSQGCRSQRLVLVLDLVNLIEQGKDCDRVSGGDERCPGLGKVSRYLVYASFHLPASSAYIRMGSFPELFR